MPSFTKGEGDGMGFLFIDSLETRNLQAVDIVALALQAAQRGDRLATVRLLQFALSATDRELAEARRRPIIPRRPRVLLHERRAA